MGTSYFGGVVGKPLGLGEIPEYLSQIIWSSIYKVSVKFQLFWCINK